MLEPMPEGSIDWNRFRRFVYFTVGIFGVLFLLFVLYQAIMVAVSVSCLLAYILVPVVERLDHKYPGRRVWIVTGIVVTLFLALFVIAAALLPAIYYEAEAIFKLFPGAWEYLSRQFDPLKARLVGTGLIGSQTLDEMVSGFDLMGQVTAQIKSGFESVLASAPVVMGGLLNFALIPVFTFFLLKDFAQARQLIHQFIPRDIREMFDAFRLKLDRTLKSVLKGQMTVALVLAGLYMIGLAIVGISNGLAIGFIAGLCRIVPYLDVVVGLTLSLVVIITQNAGMNQLVGVAIVFGVVQALDGMAITPRIVGEKAGLHPAIIIASVMAFGDWFGFFGILLAVPLVATAMVLIEFLYPYYRASRLFAGAPRDVD